MDPEVAARARLRALRPEDAETIARWGLDEKFCRAADWTVNLALETHLAFQQRLIEQPPSDLTRLGVQVEEDLVGYVVLQGEGRMRRELGFVIGERRLWRQGLGYAAARAGLVHGFTVMQLSEIWAEAVEANPASIAILRRLGMLETGIGDIGKYAGTQSRYRRFALSLNAFSEREARTAPI